MFVLDFSRRLSLAYQRPSAHVLPSDADYPEDPRNAELRGSVVP